MTTIALTSDLHLGITNPKSIVKLLKKIATYTPHLYLNLGDNCGGWYGLRYTRTILAMERTHLPEITIRAGLPGNHDYWCRNRKTRSRPTPSEWKEMLAALYASYEEFNCYLFNGNPPLTVNGLTFFGHTAWYGVDTGSYTNEVKTFPSHYPDFSWYHFLERKLHYELSRTLELVNNEEASYNIFVSHFPMINARQEKEGYLDGADPRYAEMLIRDFGIKAFLNGHAHEEHHGPVHYEAGTRYGKPSAIIIRASPEKGLEVVASHSFGKEMKED